jgi:hypothetical protein
VKTNGIAGRLDPVLAAQHGIISRQQALEAGVTAKALDWRTRRDGPWQRLLPGTDAAFTGPVDDVHRWQAALLYGGDDALLTGLPALVLHGLIRHVPAATPILVPHDRRRRSVGGVVALRTLRMPDWLRRRDFPVAEPVRALAHACRLSRDLGQVRGLVTDCLRTPKVRVPELYRELIEGPRKGSALLRAVLEEYSDGVRSAAEGVGRQRLLAMPIPRSLFNVDLLLPDGSFLARPDAYWPDAALAFEVDSREHHGDLAGWERMQRRHARMSAHGLAVLHASPHRIHTDWPVLEEEIAAAWRIGRGRPRPAIRLVTPDLDGEGALHTTGRE